MNLNRYGQIKHENKTHVAGWSLSAGFYMATDMLIFSRDDFNS